MSPSGISFPKRNVPRIKRRTENDYVDFLMLICFEKKYQNERLGFLLLCLSNLTLASSCKYPSNYFHRLRNVKTGAFLHHRKLSSFCLKQLL